MWYIRYMNDFNMGIENKADVVNLWTVFQLKNPGGTFRIVKLIYTTYNLTKLTNNTGK